MSATPFKEMSFLDHLEELRGHLIKATLAILLLAVVAFVAKDFVFNTILFGPKNVDFLTYKGLCHLSKFLGMDESMCISEMPFRIQSRKMAGQFSAHIWVSITFGFIAAFPYVIYQFWSFVSPGLKSNERKTSRGVIFASSLLFFTGVLFGYYIICPLSINFLGTYSVADTVHNDFDLDSYIGLVRASTLASGLIFELPIIIYFLTKVGLITPEILRKQRKIALVIVLIVSAVITPPDIASQIIVAIPVVILYEASIFILKKCLEKTSQKNNPMNQKVKEFNDYRSKMNDRILGEDNKVIKRIFNLDTNAFKAGALDVKTKELLGLVASTVLRCDDCVKYHLESCKKAGLNHQEVTEALNIATLVGGTIVIPHLRKAYEYWDALQEE